jgi:hypothetical protein
VKLSALGVLVVRFLKEKPKKNGCCSTRFLSLNLV